VWGIKVLISMVDADQRMVLKAMLTRDMYQCFFCDRIEALPQVLKHHANRWSHNVLFIEHGRYVGGVCVCVREVLRGGGEGFLNPQSHMNKIAILFECVRQSALQSDTGGMI